MESTFLNQNKNNTILPLIYNFILMSLTNVAFIKCTRNKIERICLGIRVFGSGTDRVRIRSFRVWVPRILNIWIELGI